MGLFFFYSTLFLAALVLTGLIRHYALATQLLDIPNIRSSHQQPTPRGGGLSFVMIFCTALLIGCYWQFLAPRLTFAILSSGILVAALGFIDDRQGLSAGLRLAGHFAAAAIALYAADHLPVIQILGWTVSNRLFLTGFSLFYLVWLLNLFNFMDGIDGLASSEVVFSCLAAVFIYHLQGDFALIYLPLSLAVAVAGFLWWNFPPAKIFMGDVGSGFLGLISGLFALQASLVNPHYFWIWLILLGVFIVDASLTLIIRALQRFAVWEAHCSHAYQQAAKYYKSHRAVTLRVSAINIFWLFPWALLVSQNIVPPVLATGCAFLPLILIMIKFKAGRVI